VNSIAYHLGGLRVFLVRQVGTSIRSRNSEDIVNTAEHPTSRIRPKISSSIASSCDIARNSVIIALRTGTPLAGKPNKKPPGGGDKGTSYAIVQLDDADGTFMGGVARDINDQRQIVGQVDDSLGGVMAVCWTTSENGGEVQSELHLLTSGGVANGINEHGEIVGAGEDGDQIVGLYWADHEADPLVLPYLAGDEESCARVSNGCSSSLVTR